jgi:hypothetical protein
LTTCPNCGGDVSEGTATCINSGLTVKSAAPNSQDQLKDSQDGSNDDLQKRLEKAMRRTELLTYAALGLGAALLAVIVIISLL